MAISNYYKYAALAAASYVRVGELNPNDSAYQNRFAEQASEQDVLPDSIARYLFDPANIHGNQPIWSILYYYGSDKPASIDPIAAADRSGFAATLFQRGSEKVLAIRGTEAWENFRADLVQADLLEIGSAYGLALSQTVAMVNLIERLKSAPNEQVTQITVRVSLAAPSDGSRYVALPPSADGQRYVVFGTSTTTGLGLIGPNERVVFTGHSLGGELAAVAALLFPEVSASDVYLFNAAGVDPVTSSRLAAPLLETISGLIGYPNRHFDLTSSAAFSGLNVHNVHSEDLAPGDDLNLVASAFTGADVYPAPRDITTERNSHSVVALGDSLALQALLVRTDPTLDVEQDATLSRIQSLYLTASNEVATSEERLTEALYKLFVGEERTLKVSDANAWRGQLDAREDFHSAVLDIQDAIGAGGFGLLSLMSMPADNIALFAHAQSDGGLAFRYALSELNPFAVIAANYSIHNANGALDRYDAATDQGSLTDEWIEDRAAFLSWKNLAYTQDLNVISGGSDLLFKDHGSRVQIEVSTLADENGRPMPAGDPRRFLFGSSASDQLIGGGQADRLYGMAGGDRIEGKAGNDYLEGGAGADWLSGGDDADVLKAGADDDVLEGGAGDDRLEGGNGFDTYLYHRGSLLLGATGGHDTIDDSDRQGRIIVDGADEGALFGGGYFRETAPGSNTWSSPDGRLTLTGGSQFTLQIGAGGSVQLGPNFSSGNFGIRLLSAPGEDAPYDQEIDHFPAQWLAHPSLQNWFYQERVFTGDLRERIRYSFVDPNHLPPHSGRAGLYMVLRTGGGGDWVELNDDFDVVWGEDGDDVLISGGGLGLLDEQGVPYRWSGADFLFGGAGDDQLFSEQRQDIATFLTTSSTGAGNGKRGDWLAGEAGEDRLMAGDRNDVLSGGEGDDLLMGGRGDDYLFGDTDYVPGVIDWDIQRSPSGALVLNGVSGTAANQPGTDQIYAGAGDDYVDAEGGKDIIYGEAGDDRIRAGEGDDFVDGGSGSDELLGGGGHDMMFGAAGDDRMFGGEAGAQDDSDDWMWGGEGRDVMSGSAGADHLFGEAGDDELHGDADDVPRAKQGDDDLFGGAGNDYLRGYAGSDLLDGGDGADELHGDEGNDALFGGDGIDLLHGEAGNDLLDGAGGDDAIGGEDGDDVLYGGEGSDTLVGAAGADRLRGDAGDDRLEGDAGNDVLDGGEGADIMAGGLGHDIFYADAADKLFDEDGDAELIFTDGTTEAELEPITFDDNGTLYQGLARDGQVVYTSLADRRSTNTRYRFADGSVLTQEQFLGGHLVEAQALLGDANANTLAGFAGDDNLSGQAGRDVLRGYAGDDWLDGGADDDSLSGGTGNDGLSGGAGNDVYRFDRGDGQDVIDERGESPSSDTLRLGEGVQPGEVQLVREASGDLLVKIAGTGDQIRVLGFYREPAQSIERIEFANGAVIDLPALLALPIAAITGSDNADVLVGTARDETLLGLAGNDVLEGDAGADRAEGGAGADRYVFGRGMGADRLLDTAGTSTLALAADLRLSDLAAHRVGDDLLLQIRGTSDSALIEGYYTTPQSWQIDDGTATLASLESIVAQTQAREADYVQALRDDYKVRAISDIAAPYLANGYRFSAPGILVHAPFQTWVQARVSKTVQTTSTVVTTLHGDGSPSTTYTLDSSYHHEDWDVSVGVLVDGRVTITNAVQLSDAAEIAPVHAWQYSDPASRVIVNVQWDRLPIFRGRTQFLHGIANSHDPVTGDASTSSSNTTIGFSSGSASGRAIGFSSVVPITDARPSSAYADLRVVRAQAVVEEIVAGAADNRISGDDSTLVDAGTGNDIVQGAGFQYGGAGDDQLSDGRVLLGGAGNDVLLAGQYLAGGAGDDLMEGDGGQTRYVLRADDVGHDLIADFSDESDAIKGWYYGTMLRISEWQARDVYGGAYRFDNDGHFEKVNARVAAWLRDPAAPPESAFDNWQQMYGGAQEHWLSAKQTVLTIPSTLRYFEPLPPFPVSSAHDYTALAPFYASGSVALDTVELPLGATLENLQATLIEIPFTTAQGSVQAYAALELALGLNQSVRIVLPHADDALGSGIERLKFADGRVLSIGDLVARLGPNANLDPQRQANVLALDDLNTLFHNAGTGYRAEGKGGDDQITGSAYGDALYGDKGNDRLNGHDGSDTLDGGLGADLLDGGAGDDALFGGEGDDLLRGGAGNDTVYADEGHDLALGQDGGDLLASSSGPDAIDAGAGADTLQAYDGQALLAGGRGDDNLTVSAADAVIAFNVGDGHDRVSVTAAFSVSLDTASSLALRRVGNDLVLGVGAQDSVTFTDWYAQAQAARPAARHFDG